MVANDQSREPRDEPILEPRVGLVPAPEVNLEDRSDTPAFEPVQRRRPKRHIRRTLIILVLLVGAVAWARWGDQLRLAPADEIPVVRADTAPIKVKPDQPGGLDIPNRDKLVYDRLESLPPPPRTENLLPRPEVPLPLPSARPSASVPTETAETKTPGPPKPIAADNVRKPERPKPVEVAGAKKPVLPPAPLAIKTEPKVAVATPAKPMASALKSAVPADNGYRVQLAAARSDQDARREWTRLRTRHSDLLGRLRFSVVRADLGDKGIYYRLRAGPMENKEAARVLCGELTKIKIGCLVVRPGS